MTSLSPSAARNLWIGLITVASTITTLLLACATPFPALAALAAVHARRADALALMVAAWILSQAVGFGLLGYPMTANSLWWSAALGTAAIGSLLAADLAIGGLPRARPITRLVLAYVAAYLGFKLVVLGWSFALDDGWAAFSTDVLARQFVRYGLILAGLVVLQRLLAMAGIDASPSPTVAKA